MAFSNNRRDSDDCSCHDGRKSKPAKSPRSPGTGASDELNAAIATMRAAGRVDHSSPDRVVFDRAGSEKCANTYRNAWSRWCPD